jgi:HlyD family secretion protein
VVAQATVVASIAPAAPAFLDARAREQAEAAITEGEAALRAAEARISQHQSDLEFAQSEHDRSRALADRGVIPRRALDDAVLRLRSAEAALAAAQSERDVAEATLLRARASLIGPAPNGDASGDSCCFEVLAPADGRVLSVANRSARLVQAGEALLEIGRPDELEIEVDFLSSDAVHIAPGAAAYVERWGGAPLAARVRRVDPAAFTKVSALGIEEQRVRVYLDFDGEGAARAALGEGFRVYVRVVTWRAEDVAQVPVSALFRAGGGWAVFRAEEGRARQVPVEVGHRNPQMAEILAGLGEGDQVVTYPGERVAEGVLVVDRGAEVALAP